MEVTRTFDLLSNIEEQHSNNDAILAYRKNNEWDKINGRTYRETVDSLSYGLLEMGLKPGDAVATVTENRPEWNFIDFALAQTGILHIPIYPTISVDEFEYILPHSETKLLFVSNAELFSKLIHLVEKLPHLQAIYTFNEVKNAKNWTEIADLGRKNKEKHQKTLETIRDSIDTNDVVTIIYTSGTTGKPKGVMLTHNNFLSNIKACRHVLCLKPKDKALSFLPLCHVLERMVNYLFQWVGVSIYYAENMAKIGDNLREIKADGFITVPRLIEKVYDRIIAKGKDLKGIKRSIFFWAVNLGQQFELDGANGWWYEFQLKIADKLVFKKWREGLGGNVKLIVSGGAALQERLCRIFWAAKMPIQEGYGLTETSPVISVNDRKHPDIKLGTVGPVVKNLTLKIAEDGEILVKGPSVMKGYYKDQQMTDEVIDKEGYLHTGDIGELIEGKYLKITDRKKAMFKLSNGKYVAPQVIENKFKESFFIEQIMVIGENEKFTAALISPNFRFLHDWCSRKKIHYRSNSQLIQIQEVLNRYQVEINRINASISKVEQIKRFILIEPEWTIDTGELTPTLKLRRKFIMKKYEERIKKIYRNES